MEIVWDEPKRQANLAKHGIDFADITEEFFASALIQPAKLRRFKAIGWIDGAVAVIFARLGATGVSIVSARTASKKERSILS